MLNDIYLKKINTWIKQNKVIDVILFGSSIRGKNKPNDIDLCIIINSTDENKSLNLIDSLGSLTDTFESKFQINILTSTSFFDGNSLAKTLLNEGYSIKNNKGLAATLGFENKSMFIYTLTNFNSSKRVKFHYLLRGRYESKGILNEVKGKLLGTGTIIIPTENEDMLKEIFNSWKIKYTIQRTLFS